MASDPLLDVENLHTHFRTDEGTVRAVDGASFTVGEGEIVGIVGESGSGKSVTGRSIIGLESPGEIVEGSITFDGTELTDASPATRRRLRGTSISMVFQDPNTTLNPVFTVGEQIQESLKVHADPDRQRLLEYLGVPLFRSRSEWSGYRERAIELMEQVGIADPGDRIDDYPHEFSGGMRQRVMLAIALAAQPDLLIADEPTTALDTTTQAQILERLRELRETFGTAVLLITHDLGVVAETCDRVVVLYGGEVMEAGPTDRVLTEPSHPYTRGLLECLIEADDHGSRLSAIDGLVPDRFGSEPGCPFASRCDHAVDECRTVDPPVVDVGDDRRVACGELDRVRRRTESDDGETTVSGHASREGVVPRLLAFDGDGIDPDTDPHEHPVLELEGVSKTYDTTDSTLERLRSGRQLLRAVDGVDLAVEPGETVGIVGESGSGKSTIVRLLTGLEEPTDGEVRLDGTSVGSVDERTREQLADVGVVFQDARSSINPRLTVAEAIAEPLVEAGWDEDRRERRIEELLELVELAPEYAQRRPHQLSGGQLQRVAIARAIALEPRLLVLDEPVSGLDVSIRAKILNLLADMRDRLGLTTVVISHDLDVVTHLADRVLVTYLGRVVERGPAETLCDRPSHPYTKALYDAIPSVTGSETARALAGEIPSPVNRPGGCAFHTRCPMAEPECEAEDPAVTRVGEARSRCHFAESVAERSTTDSPDSESPDVPNSS
ncbi:ABC transporter ATP-binding protein [Halobacteria archaeon AArc-m2/3/4]|uniref:Nickel import system ATP-binding protein NikD n=1 Tax=Natronoglomus mannanivorans TaxID=2979990 RepID=A0AAP2Z0T7_9EURY|nr:ABC transporter ATP-binding protein [Halobacteria archaeon AArc-xg1-1]MCU4973489.1 ABC transporter ATP-binding protein [Halobacteria archaeon AArc-m2/3/4]